MLGTFGFCLNASIINDSFSCVFILFEEYYYSKDDLCEIYALQDKKTCYGYILSLLSLKNHTFLAKFHDTIFIEV